VKFRIPSTASVAGALLAASVLGTVAPPVAAAPTPVVAAASSPAQVRYRTVKVDGLSIFYREAGDPKNPTVVLLHGFPTSSHMFRNLIPALAAGGYHVLAPDYTGFGNSDAPPVTEFTYTFDRLSEVIDGFLGQVGATRYAFYVQDYGAPVGYRIAARHPERVTAMVVQNGNAYTEGIDNDFWKPIKAYWADPSEQNAKPLREFLKPEGTKWQYTVGAHDPQAVSPDNWVIDQSRLDRPGNQEIQLALFLSYASNPPRYPEWQAYFHAHQPPALVVWGKNDPMFPAAGAEPYKRDLKNVEFLLLDTGHFALEEEGPRIAALMLRFLDRNVKTGAR
jgi:pimeloyl-ACP methyl ester carboxylesterase